MTEESKAARLDIENRYGYRTLEALDDLVRFGEMAARLVARGKGSFDADEALRLASEAIASRLGEAVNRLPVEFRETHDQVPWRELVGMRIHVSHIYHRVDHDMLWNALANELPDDVAYVRRLLARD